MKIERIGININTMKNGLKETRIFYRGEHPELGNVIDGITGKETEIIIRECEEIRSYNNNAIRCDLCEPVVDCIQLLRTNTIGITEGDNDTYFIRGSINECPKFRKLKGLK